MKCKNIFKIAPQLHLGYTTILTAIFLGLSPFYVFAQVQTPLIPALKFVLIGTYDQSQLDHILGPELDAFMASSTEPTVFKGQFAAAKYAVKLYRVEYQSLIPEFKDRKTIASGLIAIPVVDAKTLPLVSYQHGTVFSKLDVPSHPENSMETRVMIAQFAAQGYVVIAADYFGRGISDLPDSYLVKDSTRQATFDMLWAAKNIVDDLNIGISQFFVSGWSQGGWVSMQFLNKLNLSDVKVTAAAVASAPVDVYLTVNRWINNYQPGDAIYLPGVVAIQLQAQEYYLKQAGLLELAVRPEYVTASRMLYEGKLNWEKFSKLTPSTLPDFIRPEFARTGFLEKGVYWQTLDSNQAYRWRSEVPLRVYYGGRDEVTPTAIGFLPQETQKLLGGAPANAINAGANADHRGIFLYGILDQKKWFDSFLAK
jgi:pimeloyl-ACP methyl ester carboxylesterase